MYLHKGEIIEKAVRLKEYPIALLAKKMKKSRRHIYNIFEKREVSLDIIMQIGAIINYDFAQNFKELEQLNKNYAQHFYEGNQIIENFESYWKSKYFQLLEKHQLLLNREFKAYFEKNEM